MKARFSLAATTVLGGLLAAGSLALPASATEGYFQHGYGVRQYAVGGAGVADSRDAMSMSINPAGIVHVDRQLQLGIAAFMPYRSYEGTNTGFVADGDIDSDRNIFFVPNVAYTQPIDDVSSWGVVMYGNGGMNTSWPEVNNPNGGPCTAEGVFCGREAGVDLMQAFISPVYARQFGPLSIGIAPTVVVQRFKASGLRLFDTFGFSEDGDHLTNKGYDWSWGGGLRAGVEFAVSDRLRLGLSGQTKMWMTKFDRYAGLFKNQGAMDIPPAIVAGLAFDATPDLTLMFDYKHIFYSDVPTVGDSTQTGTFFGADNGPGFGWADVDAFKFGAEWRANEDWTLRAGYAYNTNPIDSEDVTLNILAPGVVQHHITGGFSYMVTPSSSIDFSGAYMPNVSVSGPETGACQAFQTRCGDIKLSMHQFQFALGWTYHFGE